MPTYSSSANTGYLATFLTGSAASPPVYTAVAECATITVPRYTVPDINVTHLLSPNTTEELVPGLLMPGKIAITGNFIGDATQLALDTLAQGQTIFPFQITVPVQKRAKTATISGYGFMTKNEIGPIEPNRKLDFSIEIQMTGFATIAVA